MIIEIRKAGFENKGAELMLRTIIEQCKQKIKGNIDFAIEFNMAAAPYIKRAQLGLYQTSGIVRNGVTLDHFLGYLPGRLLQMLGIIRKNKIDVFLDASGFSYGDIWGDKNIKELCFVTKAAKKNNQKYVMLPQAFDTFNDGDNKALMKKAFDNIDLVFARDEQSYENIKDICSSDKLHIAKDFTNLITGKKPSFDCSNQVVIIPNCRMLDKGDADNYLPKLHTIIEYLLRNNQEVALLNHEGDEDLQLCESLSQKFNGLTVYDGYDALEVKGIIGSCKGLISSRFHGIVSGLSQGIVTLGTGWSHKYEALFNEYHFSDGLINTKADNSRLYSQLDYIVSEDKHVNAKSIISAKANEFKIQSNEIWSFIASEIQK